jgi:YbaB/EbfC DNA-binding family
LCRAEFEGFSDDETVRVVMSGNQEPKSVDITDAAAEQGADVSNIPLCLDVWVLPRRSLHGTHTHVDLMMIT